MASHHVPLDADHPAGGLLPWCNRWLDRLRSEGDFGRLLAARGSLKGLLDGLALCREVPATPSELVHAHFQDVLCGFGPLHHFLGSRVFAADLVRTLDQWTVFDATAEEAPELAGRWRQSKAELEPEMLRALEAFEHLVFSWFSAPPKASPSHAAGWFELAGREDGLALLVPLVDAAVPRDAATVRALLPRGATGRLRTGDLLWLDLSRDTPADVLAVGHVLASTGRPFAERTGWPTARIERLPADVRSRFTGHADEALDLHGALEQ